MNSDGCLIAVLIAIVFLALYLLVSTLARINNDPCSNPASFRCTTVFMQDCLASELYTRDECLMLAAQHKATQ